MRQLNTMEKAWLAANEKRLPSMRVTAGDALEREYVDLESVLDAEDMMTSNQFDEADAAVFCAEIYSVKNADPAPRRVVKPAPLKQPHKSKFCPCKACQAYRQQVKDLAYIEQQMARLAPVKPLIDVRFTAPMETTLYDQSVAMGHTGKDQMMADYRAFMSQEGGDE